MIPIIDTNQAVKGLTKAKLTQAQAEAIVNLVGQVHEQLATKSDVTELRKDLEVTEGRLSGEIKSGRNDLAMTETRIDRRFAEMQTSIVSHSFKSTALIVGSIGLLFVMLQFFGE
ncbi:MAG: hypothetical protein KDN22_27955 [Verrucomicrobiae bacterium]|nr:hypothetical protein [Verrucomicrobiae bacterium]